MAKEWILNQANMRWGLTKARKKSSTIQKLLKKSKRVMLFKGDIL